MSEHRTIISACAYGTDELYHHYAQFFPAMVDGIALQTDTDSDFVFWVENDYQQADIQRIVENGANSRSLIEQGRFQIKLFPPNPNKERGVDNLYAGQVRIQDAVKSGYEYMLFTDIDELYQDPRYLERLVNVSRETGAAIVGADQIAFGDHIQGEISLIAPNHHNREDVNERYHLHKNRFGFCNLLAHLPEIEQRSWDEMESLPKEMGAALDWYFVTRNSGKKVFTNETAIHHRLHDSLVDNTIEQAIRVKAAFYEHAFKGDGFSTATQENVTRLARIFKSQVRILDAGEKHPLYDELMSANEALSSRIKGPLEWWENAHPIDFNGRIAKLDAA